MPSHRRIARLLWLPKLALVLLLVAVLSLLWVLHRNEQEEQRNTLISDTLWLEQNLRFRLNGTTEQLQQLAADLAHLPTHEAKRLFALRAAHEVRNITELSQIARLSPMGKIDQLEPAGKLAFAAPEILPALLDTVARMQRPRFSEPYILTDLKARVAVVVHGASTHSADIFLLGVIDLDALLQDAVPWWFAQKYQVRLTNDSGTVFGRKSNVAPEVENNDLAYNLALDPPGGDLRLSVSAYSSPASTSQRILAVAIILLSVGVFASLWIIRSQMRHRQRTEEALRAAYAFRESMENSLTVGLRARDLEGRMIYVNPAFCRMTGFGREELIGVAPPMPYWPSEAIAETYLMHRTVMSGNAPQDGFEIELRRKNGQPLRARIYEAPLIDGKGQHVGWMGSVVDVTERHKAEELARQQAEQLQATARLVTLGEMASTLAHELNQPLAAITSYNTGSLNLLSQQTLLSEKSCDQLRQALEKLGHQAQRAGRIIRRVHEFVKKREPQRQPCSLQDIIEDSVSFSEAEARKHSATLETSLPKDLPPVHADHLMVEQVLLNLIRNGLESMRQSPGASCRLVLTVTPTPEAAVIRVRDFGTGIPDELHDKLFTAFFTTKPEGLGIGLSICRSIVEFHRGQLWYEKPVEGCGSIFAFTLPWDESEAGVAP